MGNRATVILHGSDVLNAHTIRSLKVQQKGGLDPLSHVNYRFLKDSQLKERFHNLHTGSQVGGGAEGIRLACMAPNIMAFLSTTGVQLTRNLMRSPTYS